VLSQRCNAQATAERGVVGEKNSSADDPRPPKDDW
jgi:hypothetical protein